MDQTWENGKKPMLGLDFGLFGQIWAKKFVLWVLLVVNHYSKLSFYAVSRKTNEPNWKKYQKSP